MLLAFLALGVAIGVVIHATQPDEAQTEPTAVAIGAAGTPIVDKPSAAPTPSAPPSASASAPAATASSAPDDIPPGAEVPSGYGMIEIRTAQGARVRIDGASVANGPVASLVSAPGYHEVRVEKDGHVTKHVVEVRAGKVTRVDTQTP